MRTEYGCTIGRFLKRYAYPICGGVIGFTAAVLMLTIGFFQTLLLLVLTGLGTAVGVLLHIFAPFKRYLGYERPTNREDTDEDRGD